MKTVLAIGAHYDDIELGCGGTLYKHMLNGDKVIFGLTSSDEDKTGSVDMRRREQVDSMKYLGIPNSPHHIYEGYKDENLDFLVEAFDLFRPSIIFVPFEKDTHQDHVRASTIGKAVGRKRHITTYFYDSGSTYEFQPNVFSIIDFNFKYQLLQCFKSQIQCRAINVDIVKKKNSYLASLVTDEQGIFAEGFMARKMIYKENKV